MTDQPKDRTGVLDIEEIARLPLPGMIAPNSFEFSPDDKTITCLYSPAGDLTNDLYTWNPETGEFSLLAEPPGGGLTEQNVSREEALRRERQRQRSLGITHYQWSRQSDHILIPIKGVLYLLQDGKLTLRLESGGNAILDPRFSPDGTMVAYVQQNELHILPVAPGKEPHQLTYGAAETGRTHGLAEYVAQEEMDRSRGYWWSPDSRALAFEEVDETHIPVYRIVHQGKDHIGPDALEDHRYPFAGKENAHVRLGVVSAQGGEPVWMDLGDNPDIYLCRVHWLPDGSLAAELMNREQTVLDLVRFDPATGQRSLILRETSKYWLNLHNMFYPLKRKEGEAAGGFIWASSRTGFRHLYLVSKEGEIIRQLTSGEWLVDSLAGVDEKNGVVYFTAAKETPLESHLYAVSIAGGEPRRLTCEPGMHTVVLDHVFTRFIDTYSSESTPPVVELRSLQDGSLSRGVFHKTDPRVETLPLRQPELVRLRSRDGVELYGAIYRPPESAGPGPYPTIVDVYGGPHAQRVTNSWTTTVNLRAQYLSGLGFLVFTLDNRGSARRGDAFENPIYHDMGNLEVQDQVDGVRWLVEQGLADPERVGIYGWSYGGYMAAMSLARAPETFKAAVAGAPVTAWDGYDTFYTERYMGTPQSNPSGYAASAVMRYAPNIQGKLMIVHGLIDENVHFRHTARLINALIQARKPYDLLLFPDERHGPRRPADRIYMEERIRDFFLQNL